MVTRRTVLRSGGIAVASVPLAGQLDVTTEPVTIGPGDPRYRSLVLRGYNRRFEGRPEEIRVATSTEDVVRAVQSAVRTGRRLAVRGGGHCFENFVDDPSVRVLIDLSGMTAVDYDRRRKAFMVEAGATLGEVYRRLYVGWGVTIPGGTHPDVGVGGHIAGGGYGVLCRRDGLSVDHLYAVEVVVVDRAGKAQSVVATREASDPNRDLWWAHTGGGGGNFGVVTRYWFRSPGAQAALPRPPGSVLTFSVDWPWAKLDQETFVRLLRNYGEWGERNSAPGSPMGVLYGEFGFTSKPSENVTLTGQVLKDSGGERVLDDLLGALARGMDVRPQPRTSTMTWLHATRHGFGGGPGPFYRIKIKSGYLRRRFTDEQAAIAYRHLTRSDFDHPHGHFFINTYGGQVNAVAPGATAAAHRDSIFKVGFLTGWEDAAEDARHLAWIREFYREVYAASGGVPVDGTFINYPDVDLADPRWNDSNVPWHTLYYGDGYARLQRVKRRWDPRNVFQHALSVRA
ncbi:FAD-binding oxidoreductase [Actinomadura rudentiformis]|uniref:FAD-binding oxidoreductase n=1 Tax=Actinomadura rudentiformis TaxID=359158 RepID=UPI001CEF97DE|nr:FAD-binding protein [Actinomadura rudentiformis]